MNLGTGVRAGDERQHASTSTGLGSPSTTNISASYGVRAPPVERKDGARRVASAAEQSWHTVTVLGV